MREIARNRQVRKWTRREQAARVLWALARPAFALSPRPLWGWRRWLLRRFGARIGAAVHLYPSVRIACPWNLTIGDQASVGDGARLYALGPVRIGARATVSQLAHLCAGTHDWRRPDMPLVKAGIEIGDDVWVCADAFVGPGVRVGAGSVVGARACVMRDVPAGSLATGNRAEAVPLPGRRRRVRQRER